MNRIFRVGTGCGVEIRGSRLNVMAVKSRPSGVTLLGRMTIEDFRERPPQEWGAAYNAFLKGLRLSHLSCSVSLPRKDVIVREIHLPAMPRKELAAAVGYQLEGLHPYEQDEVYHAFAPLREMSEGMSRLPLAVVVAEKTRIDEYASTFEEAGIAVETFTVVAAAFYAGVRVRWDSPPVPFVIADFAKDSLEIYGEGRVRPLLSARFDLGSVPAERALQLAGADLRLEEAEPASIVVTGGSESEEEEGLHPQHVEADGAFQPCSLEEILPAPESPEDAFDAKRNAAALAVGLEAACPRLGWRANLLPPERRKKSARWMYLPTALLAAVLMFLGFAFPLRPLIQDRDYIGAVQAEVAKLDQIVAQVENRQSETQRNKARLAVLQSLRRRTEADLSIVRELSNLLPDSVWLTSLELNDDGVQMRGEADRAAPLLEIINDAETLASAEFLTSLVTTDQGDRFQIGAQRRAAQDPVSGEASSREKVGAARPAAAASANDAAGSATLETVSEAEEASSR